MLRPVALSGRGRTRGACKPDGFVADMLRSSSRDSERVRRPAERLLPSSVRGGMRLDPIVRDQLRWLASFALIRHQPARVVGTDVGTISCAFRKFPRCQYFRRNTWRRECPPISQIMLVFSVYYKPDAVCSTVGPTNRITHPMPPCRPRWRIACAGVWKCAPLLRLHRVIDKPQPPRLGTAAGPSHETAEGQGSVRRVDHCSATTGAQSRWHAHRHRES
jgi:hypothetical protein